jgi:hypothetical protein
MLKFWLILQAHQYDAENIHRSKIQPSFQARTKRYIDYFDMIAFPGQVETLMNEVSWVQLLGDFVSSGDDMVGDMKHSQRSRPLQQCICTISA